MDFYEWAFQVKTKITWVLAVQIFSGFVGTFLALTIRKTRVLVFTHVLFVVLALVGIAGIRLHSRYAFLISTFTTFVVSIALFMYQFITTMARQFDSTDIFLSSPFLVDFVVGCVCLKFFAEFYKQDAEHMEPKFEDEDNHRERLLRSHGKCCVCRDRTAFMVLYRCGHKCLCGVCSEVFVKGVSKCPLCRKLVTDIVQIYE
jgi:hypothetical protein